MEGDTDCKRTPIPFRYLAIAIVVVTAMIMIPLLQSNNIHSPDFWADVVNYFNQSSSLFSGKIPYRDFGFEYPPLMMVFLAIPRLFTDDLTTYGLLYICLATVFYVLTSYYLYKIVEKLNVDNRILCLILLATMFFLASRIVLRNDIFAMFFIAISIYYYLDKKYEISFVMLALGVMTKIFPIVIAFGFVIPLIYNKKIKECVKYVLIAAGVCLIITLPSLIIDWETAFTYMYYHGARGLQVESVAASLVDLVNLFVHIADPSSGWGSDNISGTIPDAIAKIMMPLMILVFIAIIGWSYYQIKKNGMTDEMRLILILSAVFIFVFVIFNKVFSTQYMLWLMMLVAPVICINKNKNMRIALVLLSLFSLYFSYLETYIFFLPMIHLEVSGTLVILVRNIIVVAIFALLILMLRNELMSKMEVDETNN